jgi:hypothetical protein
MKRKFATSLFGLSVSILASLLCIFPVAAEQLNNGDRLLRGKSLYSDNHMYELAMQDDGNLVLYNRNGGGRSPLWSSKTDERAVVGAIMQQDGNFVLYSYDRKPVWATNTVRTSGVSHRLVIQNDGNVVIYRTSGSGQARPVWATNTVQD